MSQETLALNRKLFDAWSSRDPKKWSDCFSDDAIFHCDNLPSTPLKGRAELLAAHQGYLTAFPDLHFEVEQEIADGAFVVTRWKSLGTHLGPLGPIPPTGKQSATPGCSITEFKNEKAVRQWVYWDNMAMLQRLGVMPATT